MTIKPQILTHVLRDRSHCCCYSTSDDLHCSCYEFEHAGLFCDVMYLIKPKYPYIMSKIEKVPRGIRGEKSSKDMASSRNLVSTIGALASPKMGDGTRCPEG